jgi:hypothetical protein
MFEVGVSKRRAIAARLLACLGPVAACLVVAVTAAAEQPVRPLITRTNPPSSTEATASSTTPSILGESEPMIIKESAPLRMQPVLGVSTSALQATKNPQYMVEIFSGEECKGPLLGRATAGAFEAEGIQVTVGSDQKSSFSAWQVDPEDPSEPSFCSNPYFYWEGNVPPDAEGSVGGGGSSGGNNGGAAGGSSSSSGALGPAIPVSPVKPQAPRIHTNPGGIANNIAPAVLGSAPAAESVLVYASEGCKGAPIAKGSPAQLQAGFQISVASNVITTFSAAAVIGQRSACSEPVFYTEDSTAPRTRITMGPGVKTRKRKAVFRFKDITEDPPGTSFACKVDKKKWKPCASPFHLKHLKYGHHLVKIRATDLAGNHERKPVERRFIVIHAGRL